MRLTELEPEFIKRGRNEENQETYSPVSIGEADGLFFLCPKCFSINKGNVGTHAMICWKPHVPQDVSPSPGRWNLVGTGYHDLTLVAGRSSVKVEAGCRAHFHITNGEVIPCADSLPW